MCYKKLVYLFNWVISPNMGSKGIPRWTELLTILAAVPGWYMLGFTVLVKVGFSCSDVATVSARPRTVEFHHLWLNKEIYFFTCNEYITPLKDLLFVISRHMASHGVFSGTVFLTDLAGIAFTSDMLWLYMLKHPSLVFGRIFTVGTTPVSPAIHRRFFQHLHLNYCWKLYM